MTAILSRQIDKIRKTCRTCPISLLKQENWFIKMNFLWIIKILKLGDTICFHRKNHKHQTLSKKYFPLLYPKFHGCYIFFQHMLWKTNFFPTLPTRTLCRWRDDFSTHKTEFYHFRTKVFCYFYCFFLRQVRDKQKENERKWFVKLSWLNDNYKDIMYKFNHAGKYCKILSWV